jgi:hypothetical protein
MNHMPAPGTMGVPRLRGLWRVLGGARDAVRRHHRLLGCSGTALDDTIGGALEREGRARAAGRLAVVGVRVS